MKYVIFLLLVLSLSFIFIKFFPKNIKKIAFLFSNMLVTYIWVNTTYHSYLEKIYLYVYR